MENNPNPSEMEAPEMETLEMEASEVEPADIDQELQPAVNSASMVEDDFDAEVDSNAVIVEDKHEEYMEEPKLSEEAKNEEGVEQREAEPLPENAIDVPRHTPQRRRRNSFNYGHRDMNIASSEQAASDASHTAQVHSRQENASAIGKIYTAMQHRVILKGTVAAVSDDGENAFFVIYMADKVEVRIPFAEAFAAPPAELLDPGTNQRLRRQTQLLRKSIGAEIQFVITDVEEQDGWACATASRTRALRSLIYRYFLQPGSNKMVHVGDILEADILAVAPYAVYICVCGIDVRLANRDLTHKFCNNLKDAYHAGDKVKVKVTGLEITATNIDLEVSGREAELDQLRGNLDRITRLLKNGRPSVIATVTSLTIHRSNGKPKCVASLYLDSLDLPAFTSVYQSDMEDRYVSGDKVIFEARGVTDKGYVHGAITRHLGRK